ncbi:60S ribosomal protein L7a [Tupaia chinensis]|uniref:60S ribosomal protein L7a n=1 Tax=Tupaia chinensis TaxID=246437 RepID=L9JWW8_TUPCH|nr:60S ribosomal protein L7a [Tupaia chinensis]
MNQFTPPESYSSWPTSSGQRLLAQTEKKAERQPIFGTGVNAVTTLVNKKAQLVATAYDVDFIKLVVFLPALCWRYTLSPLI